MSAIAKLIGLLLIVVSLWGLYSTFQAQIFSEVAQTQTPDFLDFIFQTTTPQVDQSMIIKGIIYGVIFIIGLALLAR